MLHQKMSFHDKMERKGHLVEEAWAVKGQYLIFNILSKLLFPASRVELSGAFQQNKAKFFRKFHVIVESLLWENYLSLFENWKFHVTMQIKMFLSLLINAERMTLIFTSSRSSVDGAPACCAGGHGFDSRPGLRFFLCPRLVSRWSVHFSKNSDVSKHSGEMSLCTWGNFQESVT